MKDFLSTLALRAADAEPLRPRPRSRFESVDDERRMDESMTPAEEIAAISQSKTVPSSMSIHPTEPLPQRFDVPVVSPMTTEMPPSMEAAQPQQLSITPHVMREAPSALMTELPSARSTPTPKDSTPIEARIDQPKTAEKPVAELHEPANPAPIHIKTEILTRQESDAASSPHPKTSSAAFKTRVAPAPIVRVSIGRVDVRAVVSPLPTSSARPKRPTPQLSLADYLRSRNRGQS